MRVSRAAILVVLPIGLSACDQRPFAGSEAGTSRYQLEKDNAGNLVRLDRETGEVRLLQQGKVITPSAKPRSSVTPSAESARDERASSPAVAPPAPPPTSETPPVERPTRTAIPAT